MTDRKNRAQQALRRHGALSSPVGKTLGYAARKTGFRREGYRVYLLRGENDADGTVIGTDYELARILRRRPELNRARVESAEEYYGTLILRVRATETSSTASGPPSPCAGKATQEGGAGNG